MQAAALQTDDAHLLAEHLRPALMRASRHLRREAQTTGLSPFDAHLLGRLKRSPGIGVCELAEEELVSRPSMSSRIRRLVDSGLVSRASDLTDGRRAGLAITKAGERKIEAIKRRRNDWLAKRIDALPAAERARLADAVDALTRLVGLES